MELDDLNIRKNLKSSDSQSERFELYFLGLPKSPLVKKNFAFPLVVGLIFVRARIKNK